MLHRFATPHPGETARQKRLRESAGGLAVTWAWETRDVAERTAMELVLDKLLEATKDACAVCDR